MKLFEFLSGKLNKFLRGFQTDQPMVPFLCETLEELLRSIMDMFISASTMKNATSLVKLMNIDVHDKAIYRSGDALDIGIAAKLAVSGYKQSVHFKMSVLLKFWDGVYAGLSALTSHMMEKSPLKYPLVRYVTSMNPNLIVQRSKSEIARSRFCKLLEKLAKTKHITEREADGAKEQYRVLIEDIVPRNEEVFKSFCKFADRLDTFYAQFVSGKGFECLWNVFKLVFCLSHSQSPIERGFKANKQFVVENQSEISLMALRTVQDHLSAKEVTSSTMNVTTDLCKSVKLARAQYYAHLEKKKSEQKETEKDLKRRIVDGEIDDIKKRRRFLESSIAQLVKDADQLAVDAATKKDFQILARSNDLRSLVAAKKEEMDGLDKMERSLLDRKEAM